MMSKPAPKQEEETPKSKNILTPPAPLGGSTKATSSTDAVADLERRLAQLSGPTVAETTTKMTLSSQTPETTATITSARAPVKGGKNALLARIMAAQERSKQPALVSASTSAEHAPDLLNADSSPKDTSNEPPPPTFDEAFLSPPPPIESVPPPAFDATSLPPPASDTAKQQSPPPTFIFDPLAPPPIFEAPAEDDPPALFMAPSAPNYEDLLEHNHQHQQQHTQQEPPSMEFLPPPIEAPDTSLDDIMGLQGLSPEEKRALLEEQQKIMATIEANKQSGAAARADAFESRSHQAAVQAIARAGSNVRTSSQPPPATVSVGGQELALHGAEQTQQAIADGTALMVQCLACENWMQVTQSATLMFCPVCQTVSPVLQEDAEAARQMQRDMELAEQLQKEEYKRADQQEQRATRASTQQPPAQSTTSSWLEWFGMSSASTVPTAETSPDRQFAQPPLQRGEVGVSRPPGASTNTSSSPARLVSANTDTIRSSGPDSLWDTSGSPTSRSSPGMARVAEQKPLFSCVADSIATAATSLYTQTMMPTDEEGNVHGVDSSSLLAVPQIGRNSRDDNHGSSNGGGEYYQAS